MFLCEQPTQGHTTIHCHIMESATWTEMNKRGREWGGREWGREVEGEAPKPTMLIPVPKPQLAKLSYITHTLPSLFTPFLPPLTIPRDHQSMSRHKLTTKLTPNKGWMTGKTPTTNQIREQGQWEYWQYNKIHNKKTMYVICQLSFLLCRANPDTYT